MFGVWAVLLVSGLSQSIQAAEKNDLLVVAVATNTTDAHHRFVRSLNIYGYQYEIYGLGKKWNNDGEKLQILRDNLLPFKDDQTKVILIVDAYNVIFAQGPNFVLEKFESFKPARIVFGAEDTCWPDKTLQYDYPLVDSNEKRFLNSGAYMGYASDIYEMLSSADQVEDEQLFFTNLFLNEATKRSIVLDKRADIFMNLNGAIDELELPVNGEDVYVHNSWTDSVPTVIHGNGPAKKVLSFLSNYIARSWSSTTGCLQSKENLFDVMKISDLLQWPMVYLAIFIEQPTPFLREYFEKIQKITYPKQRLSYDVSEGEARQQAIRECQEAKCDYLFVLDSIVHVDHPDTLIQLMSYNRTIVAPMLLRPGQAWSNFWGDFTDEGFYQRSTDYLEFVNYKKMGLFNVPHVAHSYLINGTFLQRFSPNYIDPKVDPDLKFCQSIRDAGYFMFITNEMNYGHLIDPDNFNTSLTQPELYEVFNNVKDWKARYLHPEYQQALEANTTVEQPCTDVYRFPFLSEEFTDSFVNLMETTNQWLKADGRVANADETNPTDDIHIAQVDFQEHWLFILRDIVQPIQQKVFTGYFSDPPKSVLNFVARYMPEHPKSARVHHNASTYIVNLALNDVEKDYEGGGCRFLRHNCSVLSTRRGWALVQPGRITHLHEDLPVSKGKRYIMASFVDP